MSFKGKIIPGSQQSGRKMLRFMEYIQNIYHDCLAAHGEILACLTYTVCSQGADLRISAGGG